MLQRCLQAVQIRLPAFVGAIAFVAFVSAAEPPKIERLFPPGGQRGSTVETKVFGAAGDGTLQAWSAHGQLTLEFTEKRDAATVTIPEDAVPGVHWLRFHNEYGATQLRPFFVGLIPETAETEPNNKSAEAQKIELPATTINGVLEKAEDVDIFAVSVPAGRTVVASMEANRELGSPMDAVLQLLDSSGTVIAQNDDDHGFDPQIVLAVPAEGTYFLRTFAFPAAPNSTIKLASGATFVYRLTITTGPFVDHVAPAVVNSTADTAVTVHGWNLGEAGREATASAFTGEATFLTEHFALPVNISAVDHPSLVETHEAGSITVPSSITGLIATAGEKDVFTLTATKGQKLTVIASARSLYSQLDPVVTVRAADGKVLKEADDRKKGDLDAEAAFTIPTDGDYTITVSDRYTSGGPRFFYVLTCEETKPGFTAASKENAFVLTAEKPVEVPIAIARSNGFAEKLTVSVQGLPEGVTAEPVVSENKGDTAKSVTLKIIPGETQAAFSGTVKVLCTTEETQQTQPAEAPIPNSTSTTADVWLTVIAAKATEPKPPESDPEEKEKTE